MQGQGENRDPSLLADGSFMKTHFVRVSEEEFSRAVTEQTSLLESDIIRKNLAVQLNKTDDIQTCVIHNQQRTLYRRTFCYLVPESQDLNNPRKFIFFDDDQSRFLNLFMCIPFGAVFFVPSQTWIVSRVLLVDSTLRRDEIDVEKFDGFYIAQTALKAGNCRQNETTVMTLRDCQAVDIQNVTNIVKFMRDGHLECA